MNEDTDFLDDFADDEAADLGVEPSEVATEEIVETAPAEEAAPSDGPARGPDGKFIRKDAEAAAEAVETGVDEDTQVPPTESEEKYVPRSVVVAMRKEIQELKAQSQQQPQQTAPERPAPLDPQEDPFGYLDQGMQSIQRQQIVAHLNTSELLMRNEVGDEPVDAAVEALRANYDPAKHREIMDSRHPFKSLVDWHKEFQTVSAVRDAGSIDALVAKRVAEQLAEGGQQAAASSTPTAATPPSLAKRGGSTQSDDLVSEKDSFDSMFAR